MKGGEVNEGMVDGGRSGVSGSGWRWRDVGGILALGEWKQNIVDADLLRPNRGAGGTVLRELDSQQEERQGGSKDEKADGGGSARGGLVRDGRGCPRPGECAGVHAKQWDLCGSSCANEPGRKSVQ